VGGDDGPLGRFHQIPEAPLGQMGDVEHPAAGFACPDDLPAEPGQPAPRLRVQAAVGQLVPVVPGEAQGPNAQPVEDLHHLQAALEDLPPFDGEEPPHHPRSRYQPVQLLAGADGPEPPGGAVHRLPERGHLAERVGQVSGRTSLPGGPEGENLEGDARLQEPGEIHVALACPGQEVPAPERVQERVGMGIDDERFPVEPAREGFRRRGRHAGSGQISGHLGWTMSLMAVRSCPSISMSVKAGMQTRSTPLGATKPRAMATAFTAWFRAPAPIACISAPPRSRITPASAPATELGFDLAETLRTSTGSPPPCRNRWSLPIPV